ncbi:hypothetical protein BGZ51_005817 [Haplosporangium sp. Z 767]|nr:hypothetical protein BGZ51_005817 [Haplosporangium sp. Z 767]
MTDPLFDIGFHRQLKMGVEGNCTKEEEEDVEGSAGLFDRMQLLVHDVDILVENLQGVLVLFGREVCNPNGNEWLEYCDPASLLEIAGFDIKKDCPPGQHACEDRGYYFESSAKDRG